MNVDDYEAMAQRVVQQWIDWLKTEGHLTGELAQDCQDKLVELIAAELQ